MSKYRRTFESLTIMGKRARIAADVLAQIAAKKLNIRAGIFFGTYSEFYGIVGVSETTVISTYRKNNKCQTCALGSMFCSLVDLGLEKDIETRFANNEGKIYTGLRQYFTNSELADIESLFEGNLWERFDKITVASGDDLEKEENVGWLKNKIPDDTERLIAIMNNIVKNRGRIKWEQI